MSGINEIEIEINWLGRLLHYTLEEQPNSRRALRREPRPEGLIWNSLSSTTYRPTTPVRIRANGGLFGSTTGIEVDPKDHKVRRGNRRGAWFPTPGETKTVGILTIRRT